MAAVHSSNVYASITTLVLAVISAFFCFIIVVTVQLHPKSKESYHLRIVFNLVMSDLLISISVIFYYIIQYLISSRQLNAFCNFYLPFIVYLFLVSYVWTMMFALRFRTMKKSENVNKIVTWKPPIKFGRLWIFPLLYILPLFIFTYTLPNVTQVWVNSNDTDQSCTFDHTSINGIVLDLVFFQVPCILTIFITIYFYIKGIVALKNSPQSVLGRQMRRAGGYLSVLLLVWLPNLIFNFISILTADTYTSFLNLCVVLSSSQGLLNVAVYVWSDPGLRRFLRKNAFFRKYLMCGKKFRRSNAGLEPGAQNHNNHRSNGGLLQNSRPSSRRRNTDDSMEDSMGSDEGMDMRTSRISDLSCSPGSLTASSAGVVSITNNPLSVAGSSSHSASTLRGASAHTNSSVHNNSEHSYGNNSHPRKSTESEDGRPKGILVPKSRFSFKQHGDISTSVGDLDQEKFVRFGE
jgi:uncharacterized membrane protein